MGLEDLDHQHVVDLLEEQTGLTLDLVQNERDGRFGLYVIPDDPYDLRTQVFGGLKAREAFRTLHIMHRFLKIAMK